MLSKSNKQYSSKFNPYEFNAGTSLAISLPNSIILASDTRHSSGMCINSRKSSKIYQLNNFFLITTGFHADGYDVYNKLKYTMVDYESNHKRYMKIQSLAHLLHNLLYSKRFFPYYSYCILAGFDDEKPFVYTYDCVGSYDKTMVRVDGSGACMIQPLFDSKISGKNNELKIKVEDENEVKRLVKVAFMSCAERDVKTGDFLEMIVLRKDGFEREEIKLRFD